MRFLLPLAIINSNKSIYFANNNYKVFANGAKNVGYKFYATGPYGTNAEPYDGRPGSIQDGFSFQGDKNGSNKKITI